MNERLGESCFVDLFLPLSPDFVIRKLQRRYETTINQVQGLREPGTQVTANE